MNSFDIVILGAGPAGLFAARELEKDYNVALIEKNPSIQAYGNRVVNKDVLTALKIDKGCIRNSIDQINFVSPSGLNIPITEKNRGFVIDKEATQRDIFDQLQNTSVFMNAEINQLLIRENELRSKRKSFKYRYLLASDGFNSFIRSRLSNEHPAFVKCYFEIFKKKDETTSCILSNRLAPGFYGWSIDLGDTVEIGLGGFKNPLLFFKEFLNKFFPYKDSPIKSGGGVIPTSMLEKRVYDKCILIGDSSGGEALMGSSIHKAIDEAKIASDLLLKEEPINNYEKLWSERFLKELTFEETVRKKLNTLSDEKIDAFFLKKQELRSDGLVTGLLKDLLNQ